MFSPWNVPEIPGSDASLLGDWLSPGLFVLVDLELAAAFIFAARGDFL
jgi:hypothetical protein